MTPHVNEIDLRAFASGGLTPEDALRVDGHLSGCARCRDLAQSLTGFRAGADELRALLSRGDHLSDEELHAHVAKQASPETRQAVDRHLEDCAVCAAQVEDLRAWVAPVRRISPVWLAMAAALLLAIVVPVTIRLTRSQATSHSLAGLEALAPADQARVRASLAAGAVGVPPLVADLSPGRETLMGLARSPVETFALVAPVATATTSDKPRFEWTEVPGASAYAVAIVDERSAIVQESSRISGTTWTPDAALVRDRTYSWQVTAYRGAEAITSPAPPAPPAKFHVIAAHPADVLKQIEKAHPDSHLLLGILELQEGAVDEARWHLERVPPMDPEAAVARRSLERIQAVRGK